MDAGLAPQPAGFSRTGAAVMAVRVAAAALALLAQVLAARLVGADAFGSYALVLVWLLLLGHASTLGTSQLVCRFLAAYRARGEHDAALGLLRFALVLALGTALVVTLVAVGVVRLGLPGLRPEVVALATLAFLTIPLVTAQDFLEAIARGLDRPLLGIGPAMLLRHLAIIAGVLALALHGGAADALTVMAFTTGGLAASVLVQALLLQRALVRDLNGATPRYRLGAWFGAALPVALLDACEVLFNNADVLILGLLAPPEVVAFYFTATRLAQMLGYVPYAITAATAQKYAALAAEGRMRELQRLAASVATVSTLAAALGALALWALAPTLLSLFGEEYRAASAIVPILALGVVVVCALGPGEDILTMLGQERACALAFAAALACNVLLNFALIPVWGMTGAAVATVLALAARGLLLAYVAGARLGIVLPVALGRFIRIQGGGAGI